MISQLYDEPKLSLAATDSVPISVYFNNEKTLLAVCGGQHVWSIATHLCSNFYVRTCSFCENHLYVAFAGGRPRRALGP
ncbi:hypothetical protein AV530_015747 [Patagioenas fasciata monilis]|uniref:Uncharacterized protein n=1 Tax=Patagioenas fasciata monilis TaxID=372326 RepID=A0A1V4KII6_PATFA|nr:hypothetical protein AV530_015747 [Patagioenas fasciata monilis]